MSDGRDVLVACQAAGYAGVAVTIGTTVSALVVRVGEGRRVIPTVQLADRDDLDLAAWIREALAAHHRATGTTDADAR